MRKRAPSRLGGPFLRRITMDPESVDRTRYPFSIRAFADGIDLELTTNVTFFVGENGSGKSTLLEAIATRCGFNPEGGSRDHRFSVESTVSELGRALSLSWRGVAQPGQGGNNAGPVHGHRALPAHQGLPRLSRAVFPAPVRSRRRGGGRSAKAMTLLDDILAAKRAEVAARRAATPPAALRARPLYAEARRGFRAALAALRARPASTCWSRCTARPSSSARRRSARRSSASTTATSRPSTSPSRPPSTSPRARPPARWWWPRAGSARPPTCAA